MQSFRMHGEYDEGLGYSPPPHSFLQRDGATFINDEEPSFISNKAKSTIFPQKLDLSTFHMGLKTPTKSEKRSEKSKKSKKPSPIKSYHDSAIPNYKETIDLDSFRKDFDHDITNIINNSLKANSRCSSATSDRAPSLSSSGSSLPQRSLSIQLERANNLVNGMGIRKNFENYEVNDSNWHLSSDDDDTRPPSSQASLTYDSVEHIRRQTSDIITRMPSDVPIRSLRNAATSTEGFLSDSYLANIYRNRDSDRTLVQSEEDQRTIVDEVFEDFRRQSDVPLVETPILRSARDVSCAGSEIIEAPRNAVTSVFERREPTTIHQSLSMLTVSPGKLRQLAEQNTHLNRSLPNLERFVIRPSTRDIYNTPLDIDAICGKGVKKNQKSADRIFSGSEIAKNIHGEKTASSSRLSSTTTRRPTSSSSAKVREPSRTRLPYCSVAPTDSVPHSLSTVTQNLLGTVKSLHPDWMPMIRKILEIHGMDLARKFSEELRKLELATELKFKRNARSTEEHDEHKMKLCVIYRVRRKVDELRSKGAQCSRVQQIKLIHTALLNA